MYEYESLIWMGVFFFIALVLIAVILYFQSERFDSKYMKNIEVIRAIKMQKLRDFLLEFHGKDSLKPEGEGQRKDFPPIEDFKGLERHTLESNRNLNKLMKKAADLKMWFDYLPRAKEFLVSASLWVFLLSFAVLVFFLSLWVELTNIGHVRYSGYLSFIWIFMGIRLFKNILRYNMVTKNINKHMDMLRDGDVEKF